MFFTGAPAPAGAGLALLPLYLGFLGVIDDGHQYAILIGPYVVLVALLMVSRIPTFSGKNAGSRIPREMVLPVLGLRLSPHHADRLSVGIPHVVSIAYLVMIPVSMRSTSGTSRQSENAVPRPNPARAPGRR